MPENDNEQAAVHQDQAAPPQDHVVPEFSSEQFRRLPQPALKWSYLMRRLPEHLKGHVEAHRDEDGADHEPLFGLLDEFNPEIAGAWADLRYPPGEPEDQPLAKKRKTPTTEKAYKEVRLRRGLGEGQARRTENVGTEERRAKNGDRSQLNR